jgi:hypothetical protein
MNKFFTALYEKEGKIIVDISVKSDFQKISEIESFIEKREIIKYERNQMGDIITILVYFDKSGQKESQSFLNNLYQFID